MTRARKFPSVHNWPWFKQRTQTKQKSARNLFFEPLEERRVLSTFQVMLSGTALTLTDTNDDPGSVDSLSVAVSGGNYEFSLGPGDLFDLVPNAIAGLDDSVAGVLSALTASVTEIHVVMHDSVDVFTINSLSPTLGQLDINGGTTEINTDISTTAEQFYQSDVALIASPILLTSTGVGSAGNIEFGGKVQGSAALTVTTDGTTTFNNAVGTLVTPLTSLSVSGPTAFNFAGTLATPSVVTNGLAGQTYTGGLTLNSDTVLKADTGPIVFGNTVSGAKALTVTATSGTTTFNNAVGTLVTPLTSLSVSGPAAFNFAGTLATPSVVTNGLVGQTYTGGVTLNSDTVLKADTGPIVFGNTVSGAKALTVTSTSGTTTFNNAVGTLVTPLTSLSVSGPAAFNFAGTLATPSVVTNGLAGQTYTGGVTLNSDTVLKADTGPIVFGNTVSGAKALTVTATSGTTTFNNAVGTLVTPLTSLSVSGPAAFNFAGTLATPSVVTNGLAGQTYTGGVTLNSDTVLKADTGPIVFGNTVSGAKALTVTATSGTTTFNNAVGTLVTPLTSLSVSGPTAFNFAGTLATPSVVTNGLAGQTYTGGLTLNSDTVLKADTGPIVFGNTVSGAKALTVTSTSGTTTFNNAVGTLVTPLTSLSVSGPTALNANGTAATPSVTTSGNQTFSGAVKLGSPTHSVVLVSNGGVKFSQTLDSLLATPNNDSLTITADGTVEFIGEVGNNFPLKELTVTTKSAMTLGSNVTTTGNIHVTVSEIGGSARADNLQVEASVQSLNGDIVLNVGDDLALIAGSTLSAQSGTVELNSVDGADVPLGGNPLDPLNANGSIINAVGSINVGLTHLVAITTSNEGDTINVKAKGITAQQLVVHGSGNSSSRVDAIRSGENATPPPPAPTKALRPAFVPKITQNVNMSDQFTMDYTDLPVDNSNTIVKYFLSPGSLSVDAGVMTPVTPVAFDGIEQLSIKANPGAVDVTANLFNAALPAEKLPAIVQVFSSGKNDRFQVLGTAGQDKISIGDVVHDSRLGRAQFELSGIQRMWVQTFGDKDWIDNISHVPALLDGGVGNDVIHNLVNDPNSRLQLLKKINQIKPIEVSLILGNEGSDELYTGAGIVDKTKPANPINAALQQFGDSGITVLFGDHRVTPLGGNNYKFTEVANIATAKDSYFSSAAQLRHGFITKGTDQAGEGVFAFGAGDKVKFSNTISWLKAQIFVGKVVNDLLGVMARQIGFYENALTPSVGEAPPETLADSNYTSFSATTDVNRDGEITPADALLVINELNSRGSYKVLQPLLAEGEADDESSDAPLSFDVDGDDEVSAVDALMVVNALNAMAEWDSPDDESVSDDTDVKTSPTYATSHDLIMLLLSSNSQSSSQRRNI